MLSKEVAKKIKKELSSFFGTELVSIVLYGSYAEGRESKYSDLRNSSPRLLNLLKHSIPVFADGTFTTVKEELQRMLDAKLIDDREEILLEHIKNLLRSSVKQIGRTEKQMKIIEYMQRYGQISSGDVAKMFALTRQAALKQLSKLVELEVIKLEGKGRGAHYVIV